MNRCAYIKLLILQIITWLLPARSVTSKFGVSFSTAWDAVNRVVMALCNLRSYFIRWPSPQECATSAARIEGRYLFPGSIGAVDGTHIKIAAPREDHDAYINRKGYHSIQLQVGLI